MMANMNNPMTNQMNQPNMNPMMANQMPMSMPSNQPPQMMNQMMPNQQQQHQNPMMAQQQVLSLFKNFTGFNRSKLFLANDGSNEYTTAGASRRRKSSIHCRIGVRPVLGESKLYLLFSPAWLLQEA